jgi:biopolymer transport protein ExbD
MLTSTIVAPNAIKVLLPEGKAQTQAKPLARVTIDKELNFFVQWDKDEPMQIEGLEELTAFLFDCREKDEEMYIALYADVSIPYGEVVKVLNIANDNEFKMVLATRQPDKK